MDTELARTFLTVITAGNFISAAERLHVSQSTVSTRIHTLEDQLGCTLFVRNKAGTTLTSAGRQFQRHAATLVRAIEQARHESEFRRVLAGRWWSADASVCGRNSCCRGFISCEAPNRKFRCVPKPGSSPN